ncbi:hypothetical protein CRM22_010745 [Opisthorchis felineus]|uniref:Uncharacterized protein n=1 Tax=Opisthorchis felineus TaxID=147828 RepID=A0A4S2KNY1_OPIFE|nr:hypothetical protein CRM22_010745 [Opisthorchis felineus]
MTAVSGNNVAKFSHLWPPLATVGHRWPCVFWGVIESESSVCGVGDIRENNVTQTGVPVHSVDSGITNQIVSEGANVTGLVVFPNVAEQTESTLAAKPDEDDTNPSGYQAAEFEDFVEEPLGFQTAPVPGSDGSQLEDYALSPDAD